MHIRYSSLRAALGPVLVTLGLIAWVALPAALLMASDARLRALTPAPAEPVWAPVRTNDDPITIDVDLALRWRPPVRVPSPIESGIVQEVLFAPGDVITNGMPIIRIANVERIAFHSETAFFRPLTRNDTGPDVQALNKMLGALGLPSGSKDTFTSETDRGVRELGRQIGAPSVPGVTMFDPQWVVYLPAGAVAVSGTELLVGQRIDSTTALFEAAPTLESAVLVEAGNPGSTVPSGTSDDDLSESPTTSEQNTLLAPFAAPEGYALDVAGVELNLNPARSEVDAGDLAVLRELTDPSSPTVSGRLSAAPTEGTFVIPVAAIYSDSESRDCVAFRAVSGDMGHAAVQIVGNALGSVIVATEEPLFATARVLISPDVEARRTCM